MTARRSPPTPRSPRRKATQEPSTPVVVYRAVELREIEALYDLTPARRIGRSKSGAPEPVYSVTPGGSRWFDLKGNHAERPLEEARVQLPLQAGGELLRTFDRRRSGIVADRWVYVFQASGPSTDFGALVHELRFGLDGHFQYVLPDRSTLDPAKHAHLQLPVDEHYYFYLAAYPLPEDALQQMATRLRSRAIYLKDDFYLDVNDGKTPDPDSARPLLLRELEDDLPAKGEVSYVLHLPCVLGEGCRRAVALQETLAEIFLLIEKQKGSDSKVGLARRIDLFTQNRGCRRFVARELAAFLKTSEAQRLEALDLIAEELCHDLIVWIGTREAPRLLRTLDGDSFVVHEGEGETPTRWRPLGPIGTFVRDLLDVPACNPFTLAANDYASADAATIDEIANIVAIVHHDLDAFPEGRVWLRENFDRIEFVPKSAPGRSLPLTGSKGSEGSNKAGATHSPWDDALAPIDAGAKMFLEGKAARKRVADPLGYILKSYTVFFAPGVTKCGLSSFKEFMRLRLGVIIDYNKANLTKDETRTLIRENANYKKAKQLETKRGQLKSQIGALKPDDARRAQLKQDLDELETVELDPRWKANSQALKSGLDALGLAINAVDLYSKLRYLGQHRDEGRAYLEVAKSSAGTLESIQTVKQINWEGKLFRKVKTPAFNYFGFAKNVLSVFGELDTLRELNDPTSGKHDRGEIRGHTLSAFGYAASAAAVVLSGGTAIVFAVAGFLLTEAGAFIADQFSDASCFLRVCTFGQEGFDWATVKADTKSAAEDAKSSFNPLSAPLAAGKAGLSFLGATADWAVNKSVPADIRNYWYSGKRDAFHDNIPAQHNALDQIQHDYTPEPILSPDLGRLLLEFEVFNPILLDPSTVWSLSGTFGIIERRKGKTGSSEPVVVSRQTVERTGVTVLVVTNPRFAFKTRYAVELGAIPKLVSHGEAPPRDAVFNGAITATVQTARGTIRIVRKLVDRETPPPGFTGDSLMYGRGKLIAPEFAYPTTVVIKPLASVGDGSDGAKKNAQGAPAPTVPLTTG